MSQCHRPRAAHRPTDRRVNPSISPLLASLRHALAGRYDVERELGAGGMGQVLLGRDVALDRPVAIKVIAPDLAASPASRQRFLREARTVARLRHPNIVAVYAAGEADGPPLLRHGVRRRREPATDARARGARAGRTSRTRRLAARRPRPGARLRARAGRGASRREAGERPARRGHGPRDADRLRRRPRLRERHRQRRRLGRHAHRVRRRLPALHEPRTGGGRARAGRPERHLLARPRRLRDVRRRRAVHRLVADAGADEAAHRAAGAARAAASRPAAGDHEHDRPRAAPSCPRERWSTAEEFARALDGCDAGEPVRRGASHLVGDGRVATDPASPRARPAGALARRRDGRRARPSSAAACHCGCVPMARRAASIRASRSTSRRSRSSAAASSSRGCARAAPACSRSTSRSGRTSAS